MVFHLVKVIQIEEMLENLVKIQKLSLQEFLPLNIEDLVLMTHIQ